MSNAIGHTLAAAVTGFDPIPLGAANTFLVWCFVSYTAGFAAALFAARWAGHLRPKGTP